MQDILPFKEWAVDTAQIETIINDLDDTLHLLSIAYDGSRYVMDMPGLEHGIDIVMDVLRMDLKKREGLGQAAIKQSRSK